MRTKRFKAALLSTLVIVSLMVPAITLLSVSPVLAAPWLEYIVVQGSATCYNTNLAGPPPERTYGLGEMPPIMAAKENIGNGRVVAAGIGRTCNGGIGYSPQRWTNGELDVLLDKAFQWMVPGATKVLWYGEYLADLLNANQYEYVFNDANVCSNLIDSLRTKGYTVDNTIDSTFTQITSGLLAPYDILVIPQLQLGDGTIGGDPDSLPDADVAAIVDFVKVGGKGLIIMEGADSTTFFCFNKVQNKILEALDFGVYFQHDSIVDTDETEPNYVTADVNTSYFGENYQSEAGKTTVRLYRVTSLLVPGPGVAVGITPEYQASLPGSTLTFSVSVTNSDEVGDNYHLTVSGPAGWGLALSDEDLINVSGLGTKKTTLTVTIPPSAAIGVEDNITVSAESTVKENVSDNDICTVLVATQITPPTNDAYTHEGRPDSKLGTGVNMFVGWYNYRGSTGAERTWLKFDLGTLPADAAMGKVKLWLYCYFITGWGSHGTRCHSVNNDDWLENEVTWNNQPTIGGQLGETKAIEETGWYSWDVTSFVQSERTGDNLVSFCLIDQDENTESDHSPWFSAKEYGDVKLWPYLEFVPSYRVDVSASPSWLQDTSPGGTLTYNIIVTNTGFSADSYSLSVTDSQGWGLTIAENQFTDVQPDQSRTTTLTVTIPSGASICTKDKITVTAAGTGVSDNVVCEAHAFRGVKLSPIADAHVSEGYQNNIYGGENALYLQSSTTDYKNERIFLKFDLSTIPFTATIIDAEVWLWCRKAESADINAQCRKVTDDEWYETGDAGVTWGTQPTYGDVLDTVALKFLPPSEDTWISWDVTPFVQSEFAGDWMASFCIKAETEGTSGQYIFSSKEWPNENERPYLKVTYPTEAPPPGVKVSISPSFRSGLGGTTLQYTVTVNNTGDVADTYSLTKSDNAGWSPSISPTSLTVPAGENRTTTLSVTIPENAPECTRDNITVTATSQSDNTISDSASCIAHAIAEIIRGIEVSISPSENSGVPDNAVTFTVTINNTGNVTEDYNLSKTDDAGWTLTLPETVTDVIPDESREVTLTVGIPSDAENCTRDNITVTATSSENAAIENSATCVAHCLVGAAPGRGVQVTISEDSKSGALGEELNFFVTVTNIGTSADTFSLTVTDTKGWSPTLSVTEVELGAGDSRPNIKLSVTIPSTAAEGESTTITVTATSQADPNVRDSETCTAKAVAEGVSLLVYVGVAVVVIVIIAAVLIIRPF